jgi:hypothetical protein
VEEVANITMWGIVFEYVFYGIGRIKYDRSTNPYCQPVISQPAIPDLVTTLSAEDYTSYIQIFTNTIPKYCSFHINQGFGTIEFRTFDSTISPSRNLLWINILSEFLVNAAKLSFIRNSSRDIKDLAKEIFGRGFQYVEKFLPKHIPVLLTENVHKLSLNQTDYNQLVEVYTNIFELPPTNGPIKRTTTRFTNATPSWIDNLSTTA